MKNIRLIATDLDGTFFTDNKDISVKTKMGKKESNPGVRLNNTKIKSLGWQVTTGLREGIKQTLDLYMK